MPRRSERDSALRAAQGRLRVPRGGQTLYRGRACRVFDAPTPAAICPFCGR